MSLDKYDLIKPIGEGSYGKVYKAKDKASGRDIAVKLIYKVGFEQIKQIEKLFLIS